MFEPVVPVEEGGRVSKRVPDDLRLLVNGLALEHLKHHHDRVFHGCAGLHAGLHERSATFRQRRHAGVLKGGAQKQHAE